MQWGETARNALALAEDLRRKMEAVEAKAQNTQVWAEAHEATCTQRHDTLNGKIDILTGYQRWQNRGVISLLLIVVSALLLPVIAHMHFD